MRKATTLICAKKIDKLYHAYSSIAYKPKWRGIPILSTCIISFCFLKLIGKGGDRMASRPKGPKQQERVNLPKSPQQPYGEPLSGSKKVKNANHSRQKQKSDHDL